MGSVVQGVLRGLLGTKGRKSASTALAQVSTQHQKLLHFVGRSTWSDAAVLAEVSRKKRTPRNQVLPS
ncbi:MAG: transposase [Candidatus Contendobacter sp.]|nr:transposase [Candidatus Contendobacter sp.]